MSVPVQLMCDEHPRYKAIRKPRVSCIACEKLYAYTHSSASHVFGIIDFRDLSSLVARLDKGAA